MQRIITIVLQCGDHFLQIGNVNLRGFSSEQVATVLRQTGPQVRIVVARPVEATTSEYRSLATHAPIIPTKMLSDPEELERQLIQTSIPFPNDFIVDVDQLISPHVRPTAFGFLIARIAVEIITHCFVSSFTLLF